MGADYVAIRPCDLQRSLGPEGFLGKLKLRAYKEAIESRVPPEARDRVKLQVQVTGREPRALDYPTICREVAAFMAGSPECSACPLAGGRPLGCYRYVTYPVDAITEEMAFAYFCQRLDTPDSIPDQLYRDIVSRIDRDNAWYTRRGEAGGLAELAQPLRHTTPRGRHVDSAQLMASMFVSLNHPALVVAYARFFWELLTYVHEERSRLATLEPDGTVRLHVHVLRAEDTAFATERVLARARALYGSRTLSELGEVMELLRQAIPLALNGSGQVLVDS